MSPLLLSLVCVMVLHILLQVGLDLICSPAGLGQVTLLPSALGLQESILHCLLKSIFGSKFLLTLKFSRMFLSHRGKLWYRILLSSLQVSWIFLQSGAQGRHVANSALFTEMTFGGISSYTDKNPCKPSWPLALFTKEYHQLIVDSPAYGHPPSHLTLSKQHCSDLYLGTIKPKGSHINVSTDSH